MGSVWWLSGLGCSLVLAQEPQAAPVVVGVPAVFAEAVRAPLQQLFADSVTLQPVANLGAQAPADVEVFLLFDEWTLARLQASQALAPAGPTAATPVAAQPPYVLAWTGECAVAVGGEIAAAGLLPDTWNELALNPSYRDRFGIVAPEVDGTPWLLAMLDRLERELVDTQGKALWRTLDARAGVLQGSYGDLVTALVEGRLQVAVGLRGPLEEAAGRSSGRVRLAALKGDHAGRFGIGLSAKAPANGAEVVRRLLLPENQQLVASAVGLRILQVPHSPLDATQASQWWSAFEASVRGRGRKVEQLADWLDLGFGAAFLVILWFLLRSQRRREAAPPA